MPDKQPNIVLIMSDGLGYEVIGANGGTSYATPRIDRMAQEGMRFGRLVQATSCWKWATSWHTGAGRPTSVERKRRMQRARIMLSFKVLHSSAWAGASRSWRCVRPSVCSGSSLTQSAIPAQTGATGWETGCLS